MIATLPGAASSMLMSFPVCQFRFFASEKHGIEMRVETDNSSATHGLIGIFCGSKSRVYLQELTI